MINSLSIGHGDAQQAIAAIQAELERRGSAAVIAVADAHGELVALLRMDGAPFSSSTIAANKAWTAARERKPSGDIGSASRDADKSFDLAWYGDARYTGWGGGVPVIVNGQVVGAVAVSGLSQSIDIELAQIGVEVCARLAAEA